MIVTTPVVTFIEWFKEGLYGLNGLFDFLVSPILGEWSPLGLLSVGGLAFLVVFMVIKWVV